MLIGRTLTSIFAFFIFFFNKSIGQLHWLKSVRIARVDYHLKETWVFASNLTILTSWFHHRKGCPTVIRIHWTTNVWTKCFANPTHSGWDIPLNKSNLWSACGTRLKVQFHGNPLCLQQRSGQTGQETNQHLHAASLANTKLLVWISPYCIFAYCFKCRTVPHNKMLTHGAYFFKNVHNAKCTVNKE